MKDEHLRPLGIPVPVNAGPDEPNHGSFMVFTPVFPAKGRTGVRFFARFTKPYEPLPPPPPPPGGGTPSNVIPFRRKNIEVSNSNIIPYRKVA